MGRDASARAEVHDVGSTTACRAARACDDVRQFHDSVGRRDALRVPSAVVRALYPVNLRTRGLVSVKETCLWCDKSWERANEVPKHPCLRCGRSDWDTEPVYANFVGAWNEYEILGETSDAYRVLWLDLRLVGASDSPRVPLSHRLKDTYRKQRNDLGSSNGRGLIIEFQPIHGNEGVWEISLKLPRAGPRDSALHYPPPGGLDYSPPG